MLEPSLNIEKILCKKWSCLCGCYTVVKHLIQQMLYMVSKWDVDTYLVVLLWTHIRCLKHYIQYHRIRCLKKWSITRKLSNVSNIYNIFSMYCVMSWKPFSNSLHWFIYIKNVYTHVHERCVYKYICTYK